MCFCTVTIFVLFLRRAPPHLLCIPLPLLHTHTHTQRLWFKPLAQAASSLSDTFMSTPETKEFYVCNMAESSTEMSVYVRLLHYIDEVLHHIAEVVRRDERRVTRVWQQTSSPLRCPRQSFGFRFKSDL